MSYIFPTTKNKYKLLIFLIILLFCGIILTMPIGSFGFEFKMFTNPFLFKDIIYIRTSRIILSILIGASLGITGSALQAILRNPLADPFIIGVTGGATLGGAICMGIFPSITFSAPIFSIIGSLIACLSLYKLFLPKYNLKTEYILLSGVAFNMFSSSVITLMKIILPQERSRSILFWLIGTIQYVSYNKLIILSIIIIIGCNILIKLAPIIEIISQGDEEAIRLGINVKKTKIITYLISSIMLGIIISYSGMIGFIGLIVPNILRIKYTSNQIILLPASMFLGSILLLLFDALSRYSFFLFQTQIPVGALSTLIGSPIFLWLILSKIHLGKIYD